MKPQLYWLTKTKNKQTEMLCVIGSGGGSLVDRSQCGQSARWLRIHRHRKYLLRRRQEQVAHHCQATQDERLHQNRFVHRPFSLQHYVCFRASPEVCGLRMHHSDGCTSVRGCGFSAIFNILGYPRMQTRTCILLHWHQ